MTKAPKGRGTIPPPSRNAITLIRPTVQRDAERISALAHAGPSPTVPDWPAEPEGTAGDSYPPRPTPASFVKPERPEHRTGTLTRLRGVDAGQSFRLTEECTVLGRGHDVDIMLSDEAVSRRHARVLHQDEDPFVIEDLGSTNGTYVQGQRVQRTVLVAGDRVQLGPAVTFRFSLLPHDEESLERRLFESSTRDPLTGLLNRSTLEHRLDVASDESSRTGRPYAVLMIDLDHFKRINDTYGHPAGDDVLRTIAKQIARAVRTRDLVARYGGEEFAIVAGATTAEQARALAERVRSAIAEVKVGVDGTLISTTACVGVASSAEQVTSVPADLLAKADRRLYDAKRVGRNRVRAH